MEKEENKRLKISDRGLSSEQLFQTPSVQPTVGAGGQYNIQVQQQAVSPFTKLAESLSSLDTGLQKVAENYVQAEELASVKAADMQLEDAEAQAREVQEAEDTLYKGNSFVDRLVRRGEASALENPMFYSRGQRAYGARIGTEKYVEAVTANVNAAKEAFRTNRTEFSVEQIQKDTAEQMMKEHAIDSFSSDRGFAQSISKFNTNQRIKMAEEQDKLGRIHSVVDYADEAAGVITGSSTQSDEFITAQLKELSGRYENLSASDFSKALKVALSKSADSNYTETQKFINKMRSGEYDVMLGGVKMNSTMFESTLDDVEGEIAGLERKQEREAEQDNQKFKKTYSDGLKAVTGVFSDGETHSLTEAGIEVPEGMQDSFSNPDEALTAYRNIMNKQQNGNMSTINAMRSVDYDMGNNTSQIEYNEIQRQRAIKEGIVVDAKKSNSMVINSTAVRLDEMVDNKEIDLADVQDIVKKGEDELNAILDSGLMPDNTVAKVGDIPLDEASHEQKRLFAKNYTAETYRKANELMDAKKQDNLKVEMAAKTETQGDDFPQVYKKYTKDIPDVINNDLNDNILWAISKADSPAFKEKNGYDKFLRNNPDSVKDEIVKLSKDGYEGIKSGFHIRGQERRGWIKLTPEEQTAQRNLAAQLLKRSGITYDELKTLRPDGSVMIKGHPVKVTDALLRYVPIRGENIDFKEAARIINDNFSGSDIKPEELRLLNDLDEKRRTQ